MDLLASKKFKALLALVILWTDAVSGSLGLSQTALMWLTGAFSAYFLSQSFRDFGEEIVSATRIYTEKDNAKKDPKGS